MSRLCCAAMVLVFAPHATAASFNARLESANDLLRRGKADAALRVYRDLLVEEPESLEAAFGAGCAEYELAASPDVDGTAALAGFAAARRAFEEVAGKAGGALRRRAAYNAANATAQQAKQMLKGAPAGEAVGTLRESINAYERVLSRYPEHGKARHNLDHVRYLMKTMLRQEQQQQPQDGEPEEQDDEEKQQKDTASQEPSPQEDSSEEQNEERQQKPSPSTSSEMPEGKQPQARPQPDINQENMEAILQSLEEKDRKEQQERYRARISESVPEEWW